MFQDLVVLEELDGELDREHFPEVDDMGDIIADIAAEAEADEQPPGDAPGSIPPPPLPPPAPEGDERRIVREAPQARAERHPWNKIPHPAWNGYMILSQTAGNVHWDFRSVLCCARVHFDPLRRQR